MFPELEIDRGAGIRTMLEKVNRHNDLVGVSMKTTRYIAAGIALAVLGSAAGAGEVKIYPYGSSENYCPNGLQPIAINGVICCGNPNVSQSYQQVMAHPAPKKKVRRVYKTRAADTCPEGVKGCY